MPGLLQAVRHEREVMERIQELVERVGPGRPLTIAPLFCERLGVSVAQGLELLHQ